MSEAPGAVSLEAVLRAQAPASRHAALDRLEGLEALLRGLYDTGRAQWPSLPLSPERFVWHLARHLPEGSLEVLRQLHAADLYLACACAGGERPALEAFEQHILQRAVSRLGQISPSNRDEVLQLLRQRLLLSRGDQPPRIADYSGRGPLLAWVRIIAVRIAVKLAGQEGQEEPFEEPPEALSRMLTPSDPERELLREDSRQALTEALRKSMKNLSERERTLLRLHHLYGLTMDRLSVMYGESRSGIARRVVQARERLLKLTRSELALKLQLTASELESLVKQAQSQLDLSLVQLME